MNYKYQVVFSKEESCTYESKDPQKWINLAIELLQKEYQETKKSVSDKHIMKIMTINNKLSLIDAMQQIIELERENEKLKQEVIKQEKTIKNLENKIAQNESEYLEKIEEKIKENLVHAKENKNVESLKKAREGLNEISKEKIKRKKK